MTIHDALADLMARQMAICAVCDFRTMNVDQLEANAHMVQTTLLARELTERAEEALAQAEAATQALRESEDRYRTLFELCPVAVYSCETSGVIQQFNDSATKLWGRSPIAGDTDASFWGAFKLYRPDGTPMPHALCPMTEVLSGATATVRDAEVLIERPDGSRMTVIVNIRPLRNDSGEVTGAINCFYDVTERKRHEQALHNAVDVREQILAIVSHELRNPLSSIIMSAHALLLGAPPDDRRHGQRRKLEVIERSGQRMTRLIDDLADFASIQSGHFRITKQSHNPAVLVREVLTSFELLASGRGLAMTSEIAVETSTTVDCDRDRLIQVLSNLIGNAVKVTAAGGAIVLRAQGSGRDILFSVTDTGPGIANDDLEHIFARYWRGEKTAYKGTGLGLAIARGIVTAHGGKIWAESTVGVGTTFFFTIDRSGEEQSTATSNGFDALSPTILVVDDEPDIREIMSELLQREGFRVITAANGSDALARLRDVGPPPCLIILDLTMPVMDGWAFVAERDKDPVFASIPLIVVSGTHDLQLTAASLHATAFMRKPLQAADLIAMAHNHCGVPRQALHR